ncbi:transcription termination/antitermination NusG family protein [Thalassovita gelatinovora]
MVAIEMGNQDQPVMGAGLQWYAVRVMRPRNPNRRTALIGAEKETYRDRGGRICVRPRKGTGARVYVPELILRRAGFSVFMPKDMKWRRVNRFAPEKKLVAFPLLADWIFVGWPRDAARWHELCALDVVAGVLGTGGRPARISEKQMVRVMRDWGGGKQAPDHHRYMRSHREFEVDDVVSFADGSMEGCPLRVVGIEGAQARIMVRLFGRETEWLVQSGLLKRAEK